MDSRPQSWGVGSASRWRWGAPVTAALFMHGVQRVSDATIRDNAGRYESKIQRRTWRVVRAVDGVVLYGCPSREQAESKAVFLNEQHPASVRVERGGL